MTDTALPPPRSRSVRVFFWLCTIFGSMFVILLLIHAIWSWRSGSALDRYIAELAARGEPVTFDTIRPKSMPDEQNAYVEVRRALSLLPPEREADKLYGRMRGDLIVPLFDDERELLRQLTADTDAAIAALRPAVGKPGAFNDQLQFKSPFIQILLPDLSALRRLTNTVSHAAMLDLDAGRHDAAVEKLFLIEPIGKCAAANTSLIGSLVAVGVRAVAAARATEFAPTLKIGTQTGDASPEIVRKLISELLQDQTARDELLQAMRTERLMQIDTFQMLVDGNLQVGQVAGPASMQPPGVSTGLTAYVARPLLRSNARYAIENVTKLVDMLSAPEATNWQAVKVKLQPLEAEVASKTSWRYRLAAILVPSMSRAPLIHFRSMTDRHLAATALAIRLYQLEHDGALPASLNELAPKYLLALPLDPMSAGKPLSYRAGETPILWSTGDDGVDDGGSVAPAGKLAAGRTPNNWETKDYVLPLSTKQREKSSVEDE